MFERYLPLWVGPVHGRRRRPGPHSARSGPTELRKLEFGSGSQINVPIAVLIWLMIVPMMMKIDFASLAGVGRKPKGLLVTLFVNWLVKPFSMFALGWLFFQVLFLPLIGEELAKQYTAGVIILAAAPCTAMVFVWSYLTDGDPAYTLVQVAVNDLDHAGAVRPASSACWSAWPAWPCRSTCCCGRWSCSSSCRWPPACWPRTALIRSKGKEWFEKSFLPRFQPVAVTALLATLVLIFAFQADNILNNPLHVGLIAVPILIQVYFNSSLTYGLMWLLGVPHNVAAPGALIGASNFFELAVATAIALYGPGSGAALATVVGVLVEVPVMLSVCAACNRTRGWFAPAEPGPAEPGPVEMSCGIEYQHGRNKRGVE